MTPKLLLPLFIGLSTLSLQAQQSVYEAKKSIVAQMNVNKTRCTWDLRLYKEKEVNGKTGLYTSDGREIIPPQFKEILGPPYAWFVLAKKADADKYALFNLAGTKLTEDVYYSMVRVPNSACALRNFDEADPACRDDTYAFSLDYLCSYYLALKANGQRGLLSVEHETLIPFEFGEITHAGGSRFVTAKAGLTATHDLFDVETQTTLLREKEDIKVYFIDQAAPIYIGRSVYQDRMPFYAVKENGKWQLLDTDLSKVFPKEYDEISIQDAYVIARTGQLFDLYTANGDLLISEAADRISSVISGPDGFVYVTEKQENYTYYYTLFNSDKEKLLSWENGRFLTHRTEIYGYASMVVNEMPKKKILAFISIDATTGIFLFEDLSHELVERQE
ncbi:MAG: hypothetical protein KDC44_15760 [Phaeodactylibacter sp.]|nr:hypothetical protein [Phaeodactylibacter sp.]